jgi:hypothetical protein
MKLRLVLLPALLMAPLLDPKPVESKTQSARMRPDLASNATMSRDYQSAMYECEARYAGPRGYLGRDRYAYIEQCFKDMTGKTPAQMQINCSLRRC